ncbi:MULTISPECIES: glucokinase [unclassified Aureimonas]|uniref:glucokinase n=1 Tax=unclassified Aureimonas TaxID=2615206 RepID=UPI000700D3A6|nr:MULTISPECIES: glucokinase [unclassified Aureimonas]KQT64214.1 glucokinase [Aureimonas sp. Leaf427]KQT81404.1 glucokinase [Aureimonas sp. Leaf460]
MSQTLDSTQALKFPILIGDIGGTNARFAILIDAFADPKSFPIVQTADFATIDEAIQFSVLDKTSVQPKSAVLAVAGPVDGNEIHLTNCPWVLRPMKMLETLGLGEIIVLNDFEAQALAVSSLPNASRQKIGGGTAVEGASRVVVGPGTGLGVAGLVRARKMWIPVAGEGGHIDLGPRTDRDRAIWPHLRTIEGRVSAEEVLSGRGLVNVYDAVCRAEGAEPVFTTPAEVTDAAIGKKDVHAGEAVDLFATYLGRVAGDLGLIFMARGGVYIAGGIFQRIIPILRQAEMREAFEDKAPHRALLRDMPLYVITEPLAALAGLATFARTPRFFGIETTGRRWTV